MILGTVQPLASETDLHPAALTISADDDRTVWIGPFAFDRRASVTLANLILEGACGARPEAPRVPRREVAS